jgi:hypothetical protein
MDKNFSRKLSAFGLIISLFTVFSAPATLAQKQPQQPQTDSAAKTKNKTAKTDNKTNVQMLPANQTTSAAAAKKPLSVNEDPAMIGKRNINKGFSGWLGGSQAKEVQFGRALAAEVEKEVKLVDDSLVTEYVNRVGQNIVNHSDAKVPFTIKVIDSDEVNAFALPGGFFYVNKGLILAADNESELAGVMAHEIAHVAARHAMENQGKATLINYGMLAGIIFGGGILSNVLYNGGGFFESLAMLKFSRGAEEEADRLGVQYMYAAGYDPSGMATMFEKLSEMNKKRPGKLAKMFMTHPESLERRDAAVALAARFPEKEEYVISTSDFQRVKQHLMKISNVRTATAGDIENTSEPGRPTLKRRAPENTDSKDNPSSSDADKQNDKAPPKLVRRDANPQPSPSPSPNK